MGHSTNGVASVVTPSCEQRALALGLTFAPSSAAGMLPVVCWHGATPPLCLVTSVRSSPGIPSRVCVRTRVHPRPRSPRRRGGPLRPLCCDQRYAGVAAPRIAPCHLPLAPRRDWPAVLACIHTFAHVSTSVHSYMFVHARARAFRRRAGRHQRTSPTARCSAQRRPSTVGTSRWPLPMAPKRPSPLLRHLLRIWCWRRWQWTSSAASYLRMSGARRRGWATPTGFAASAGGRSQTTAATEATRASRRRAAA